MKSSEIKRSFYVFCHWRAEWLSFPHLSTHMKLCATYWSVRWARTLLATQFGMINLDLLTTLRFLANINKSTYNILYRVLQWVRELVLETLLPLRHPSQGERALAAMGDLFIVRNLLLVSTTHWVHSDWFSLIKSRNSV